MQAAQGTSGGSGINTVVGCGAISIDVKIDPQIPLRIIFGKINPTDRPCAAELRPREAASARPDPVPTDRPCRSDPIGSARADRPTHIGAPPGRLV